MADQHDPDNLAARLRAGDPRAAAELLAQYEPIIRSRIRVWLRMQDERLRRVFDSMDICQSVMASFFVRAAAGQYDLDQPEQLLGLLVQMARHKLAHQISRQTAQRRDVRRVQGVDVSQVQVAIAASDPGDLCAQRELLDEVRRRLTAEELRIADERSAGRDWASIAATLGGTANGRRMQLARALDRVADELGLRE